MGASYDDDRLNTYAAEIRSAVDKGHDAWCVFDNTAASAATGDALALMERM
jgi:uncharacterized protein YecE (DUF72 family)